MTEDYRNVTPSTTESTRLQEIRARVGDSGPITIHGPEPLVRAFEQKDADIAWLLKQVEELTKRVRMYEVIKS